MRPHQLPHERILGVVGVLIFVHQNMPEFTAIIVCDFGELLEQKHGFANEVVKVEGVRGAKALGIDGVNLRDSLFPRVIRGRRTVFFGAHQLVFEGRNPVPHGLGGKLFGVQVQLFNNEREQALRIRRIVNREGRFEPERLGFSAQHAHAEAVEGGNPHVLCARADQRLDALTHFRCGLVREGDGENLPGSRPPGCEQMGDAVRQHAGFARPGPGDDQQG